MLPNNHSSIDLSCDCTLTFYDIYTRKTLSILTIVTGIINANFRSLQTKAYTTFFIFIIFLQDMQSPFNCRNSFFITRHECMSPVDYQESQDWMMRNH